MKHTDCSPHFHKLLRKITCKQFNCSFQVPLVQVTIKETTEKVSEDQRVKDRKIYSGSWISAMPGKCNILISGTNLGSQFFISHVFCRTSKVEYVQCGIHFEVALTQLPLYILMQ